MVNLIPAKAKRNVAIEYWLRVLTVWALIMSVVSILFALTMLPVYVSVDTKIDAYAESAAIASQKIASFDAVSTELTRATEQARLVISSTDELSLSKVIDLFDALETGGVEYTQVSISKAPGGGLEPVTLVGNAENRQALADFRDRLLAQEEIETVDFPIENLAKDRDITFAITVTMSNQFSLWPKPPLAIS